MSEKLIGPNPCPYCGYGYGEHKKTCIRPKSTPPTANDRNEGVPIQLNSRQQELIKEWSADSPHGDLWGNDEARAINLATFARSILSAQVVTEKGIKMSAVKSTVKDWTVKMGDEGLTSASVGGIARELYDIVRVEHGHSAARILTPKLAVAIAPLQAESAAKSALLKLPDDYCLACGGTGGHHEGCKGTSGLMALQAELEQAKETVKNCGELIQRLRQMVGMSDSDARPVEVAIRSRLATAEADLAWIKDHWFQFKKEFGNSPQDMTAHEVIDAARAKEVK